MSEALWTELQRVFHVWTGNRLRLGAHTNAVDEIETRARRHRMPAEAYLRALDRDELHAEREELIDRLVNRTTWFMRDVNGIHALVDEVKQRQRLDVKVWVAGCSTGQEPYTLAMALLDAGLRPHVLATDISREALVVAAKGRYRTFELARVPERWKRLYFVSVGQDEMRVAAQVRDCITFQYNNLAAGVPASAPLWDAVVCRNVLLHFEREHAIAIIRSLHAATAFLLLSPVEQPLAWLTQSKRLDTDDVVLLRGAETTREPPALPVPAVRVSPPVIESRATVAAVRDLVGLALQQLASGNTTDAIALCDAAIAGDRLCPAAHLAKGVALKRAGRSAEAIPALRCARFLGHDEEWLAPYTLARCLERAGDRDGAAEAYRHALDIIDAGGTAGLSAWDPGMDVLAHTVRETCSARLLAIGSSRQSVVTSRQ